METHSNREDKNESREGGIDRITSGVGSPRMAVASSSHPRGEGVAPPIKEPCHDDTRDNIVQRGRSEEDS